MLILSVIMLNVLMLSVIMLSVVNLSVVVLNVVAPKGKRIPPPSNSQRGWLPMTSLIIYILQPSIDVTEFTVVKRSNFTIYSHKSSNFTFYGRKKVQIYNLQS